MLKMFHDAPAAGGSVAFWEQAWRDGDYTESARFCDSDPLRPLLDRHARPDSVMLEGGCGRGAYVARHSGRGVRAVGVDFAVAALADVRQRYPTLLLGAADVSRLPIRARAVATYYSGGVVEHFEAGPHDAIAEARRVLHPTGVLLISVPYYSPLRRLMVVFHRHEWRRTTDHQAEAPPPGRVFFQYAYRPAEFDQILTEQGFLVLDHQGYSVLWGLYELPLVGRILGRTAQRPRHPPTMATGGRAANLSLRDTSLLKRLVVGEDDSVPILGWFVRVLRWMAANMMMYVCTPAGAAPS